MMPAPPDTNPLFGRIADLIELARRQVVTAVNLAMVHTYFEIGRTIVDDEQQGKVRAEYGKAVLPELAKRLTRTFGRGFSVRNLEQIRQFYLTYAIPQTASAELQQPRFQLPWSHYLLLIRIANPDQRSFYELECAANHWGLRELQRQLDSTLYERLALSRDKHQVRQLAESRCMSTNMTATKSNPTRTPPLAFYSISKKTTPSLS